MVLAQQIGTRVAVDWLTACRQLAKQRAKVRALYFAGRRRFLRGGIAALEHSSSNARKYIPATRQNAQHLHSRAKAFLVKKKLSRSIYQLL